VDHIIKIAARTWRMRRPIRLGQEFSGYARAADLSKRRAVVALEAILELPAGGHRGRTGITHTRSSAQSGPGCWPGNRREFRRGRNHFEPNANRDAWSIAGPTAGHRVTLSNVANNIRWLGSGPRCGFYEVMLPDLSRARRSCRQGQPVMWESHDAVAAKVIGDDQAVAFAGATGGQFELNIMMPMMGQGGYREHRAAASAPRHL